MPEWRADHPGVEELKVAVMGCVVNGPGESKHANIGISLPGTFEEPVEPVFIDGKMVKTLRGDHIVAEFLDILERYVAERYSVRGETDQPHHGPPERSKGSRRSGPIPRCARDDTAPSHLSPLTSYLP